MIEPMLPYHCGPAPIVMVQSGAKTKGQWGKHALRQAMELAGHNISTPTRTSRSPASQFPPDSATRTTYLPSVLVAFTQ
jgi:hypothetical protein